MCMSIFKIAILILWCNQIIQKTGQRITVGIFEIPALLICEGENLESGNSSVILNFATLDFLFLYIYLLTKKKSGNFKNISVIPYPILIHCSDDAIFLLPFGTLLQNRLNSICVFFLNFFSFFFFQEIIKKPKKTRIIQQCNPVNKCSIQTAFAKKTHKKITLRRESSCCCCLQIQVMKI